MLTRRIDSDGEIVEVQTLEIEGKSYENHFDNPFRFPLLFAYIDHLARRQHFSPLVGGLGLSTSNWLGLSTLRLIRQADHDKHVDRVRLQCSTVSHYARNMLPAPGRKSGDRPLHTVNNKGVQCNQEAGSSAEETVLS